MSDRFGDFPLSADTLKMMNIGMWVFEFDNGLEPRMYMDDAMLALLGFDKCDTPEKAYSIWYERMDESFAGLLYDAVERMASGVHAEVQGPWRHPDGHMMIIRLSGARNSAYGKGIRVEGICQDVSEVQSTTIEQARQRQRLENDYKTIKGLTNEYVALHLLNLETDEFTPFYIENESVVDPDFLLGSYDGFYSVFRTSVQNTVHHDYQDKMLRFTKSENIKEVLRNKSRHVERILKKNQEGGFSWYDFVLIKLDDISSEASRIAIGYINVDEEMEALLAERARVERIERAVHEECRAREAETERYNFLINVTHEIRTPLTLIMGPLERLQKTEALSEKGSKTVSKVRQQAARMNILLNTVLASNRMEEGAEKLCAETLPFNDWIRGAVDDFSEEAEGRGMPVKLELDSDIGLVSMDKHLCDIVFSNFIINAMRYNETGNDIVISTRLGEEGSKVRVSFKDRGSGIDEVDPERLFERYYRATEDKTGFGIGLFYSRNIIKAHGGEVGACNNTDGCGATFWFELPL